MLTQQQIQELESKNWTVKSNGCYLTLYRADYTHTGWLEICNVVGNSWEADFVNVLIFGYNEN